MPRHLAERDQGESAADDHPDPVEEAADEAREVVETEELVPTELHKA